MGPLDAIGHLLNLFLPALLLGALSAAAAKLAWRRELATVPWRHLAGAACAASAGAVLLGLVVFGRDGTMAMYAAMVTACAFTLWWRGFGPGRTGKK
jgi:hypothetical protein